MDCPQRSTLRSPQPQRVLGHHQDDGGPGLQLPRPSFLFRTRMRPREPVALPWRLQSSQSADVLPVGIKAINEAAVRALLERQAGRAASGWDPRTRASRLRAAATAGRLRAVEALGCTSRFAVDRERAAATNPPDNSGRMINRTVYFAFNALSETLWKHSVNCGTILRGYQIDSERQALGGRAALA